jgi:hypothetical protein
MYKSLIFHVLFAGVNFTLRGKCGLMVFDNMVIRSVFLPKGDEVTGGWTLQSGGLS